MKKIPLTKGEVAIVDDCDYDYLMQWKWCFDQGYAIRMDGSKSPRRKLLMHREILRRSGFQDFEQVDHIDRDRLNNCRSNLRPATASQNQCNHPVKRANNTNNFKGVNYIARDNKWEARIQVEGRQKSLGTYEDIIEAAHAYNKGAKSLHGDFAVLNQISTECPACACTCTRFFHNFPKAPLAALSLPETYYQAKHAKKLPLNFYICLSCGHVFNVAFSEHQLNYTSENNLMYNNGDQWQKHFEFLAALDSLHLKQGVILDIGAGNGEFLALVQRQNPLAKCIAFEPGPGAACCRELGLETYQDFFQPACDLKRFQPRQLILRHVCEHFRNPRHFLTELSYWAIQNSRPPLLLVEVPCIEQALKQCRVADFFYEHPQHFTQASLQKMMESCGWITHDIFLAYNQEVVVWIGRPDLRAFTVVPNTLNREAVRDIVKYLQASRDSVAFWGGTGKGAAFLNAYEITDGRVIDSDVRKAGRYVPGTGQLIEHAGSLRVNPVDTVIITTRWRAADIYAEIKRDYPCVKEVLVVEGDSVREYTEEDYIAERNIPYKG